MRQTLINVSVVLLSVLVTFTVLEVGYRITTYQRVSDAYAPYSFWWTDQPFYLYDAQVGYRYPSDAVIRHTRTDQFDHGVHAVNVHLNNIGNVSYEDDMLAKAPGEYRIALIGDSFTAGVYSAMPYGDLLQDLLNADDALKRAWGAQTVNVMNFGMDAIGMAQFAPVYTHRVQAYAPDLIVLTFISDDIRRRFLWRDLTTIEREGRTYDTHLTCYAQPVTVANTQCLYGTLVIPQHVVAAKEGLQQMREDLYRDDIARRPWGHVYPEFFASLAGFRFGMLPRLEGEHPAHRLYPNDAYSLHMSREALDTIITAQPNTLLLHLPVHTDLIEQRIEAIGRQFIDANPDLNIIETLNYFPDADTATIESWYNLPFDAHFNAAGAQLYAEIVQQILHEQSQN